MDGHRAPTPATAPKVWPKILFVGITSVLFIVGLVELLILFEIAPQIYSSKVLASYIQQPSGGGGAAAPAFQTYGYNAGSFQAATANATTCAGIIFPTALSVGHLYAMTHTGDGSNNSDIGIYNAAGALVAHVGAQHISAYGSLAFVGGTQTIPAGKGYYCFTSAASTLALEVNTAATSFFALAAVLPGGTTSGGALLGSITPPADIVATGGGGFIPVVILLP